MNARLVIPLAAAIFAAGCGGAGTETVTVTRTVTVTETEPLPGTQDVRVYFLRDGKVAAARREIPRTRAVAAAALEALLRGPTDDERAFGLATELPTEGVETPSVSIDGTRAVVDFPPGAVPEALAQLVYTVTQFEPVGTVEIAGTAYTRADFEELTPAILVESPLPFENATAPLRVTGTANTFEATFEYELTDPDGKIVESGFTTATSGSGTRGTFDFSIPFEVAESGLGELIVFERSAADGTRTNLVEIPIRFGAP